MKKGETKYSFIAILMLVSIAGALYATEQMVTINLLASLTFCLTCSAVLLFCLMKLNVMEFQEGSFWHRVNQWMIGSADKAHTQKNSVPQYERYVVPLQRAVRNAFYKEIA